jgi:hypothetical protein
VQKSRPTVGKLTDGRHETGIAGSFRLGDLELVIDLLGALVAGDLAGLARVIDDASPSSVTTPSAGTVIFALSSASASIAVSPCTARSSAGFAA